MMMGGADSVNKRAYSRGMRHVQKKAGLIRTRLKVLAT